MGIEIDKERYMLVRLGEGQERVNPESLGPSRTQTRFGSLV